MNALRFGGLILSIFLFVSSNGYAESKKPNFVFILVDDQGWNGLSVAADRCEMNNLAAKNPKKVAELKKLWQAWAKRAQVLPLNPPQLDPKEL